MKSRVRCAHKQNGVDPARQRTIVMAPMLWTRVEDAKQSDTAVAAIAQSRKKIPVSQRGLEYLGTPFPTLWAELSSRNAPTHMHDATIAPAPPSNQCRLVAGGGPPGAAGSGATAAEDMASRPTRPSPSVFLPRTFFLKNVPNKERKLPSSALALEIERRQGAGAYCKVARPSPVWDSY